MNDTSPSRRVLEQVLAALGKEPGFGAGLPDELLLEQITRAAEAGRRSEAAAYEDLNRVIGLAQGLIHGSRVTSVHTPDLATLHYSIGCRILTQIRSIRHQ